MGYNKNFVVVAVILLIAVTSEANAQSFSIDLGGIRIEVIDNSQTTYGYGVPYRYTDTPRSSAYMTNPQYYGPSYIPYQTYYYSDQQSAYNYATPYDYVGKNSSYGYADAYAGYGYFYSNSYDTRASAPSANGYGFADYANPAPSEGRRSWVDDWQDRAPSQPEYLGVAAPSEGRRSWLDDWEERAPSQPEYLGGAAPSEGRRSWLDDWEERAPSQPEYLGGAAPSEGRRSWDDDWQDRAPSQPEYLGGAAPTYQDEHTAGSQEPSGYIGPWYPGYPLAGPDLDQRQDEIKGALANGACPIIGFLSKRPVGGPCWDAVQNMDLSPPPLPQAPGPR